ncbi:MAG: PKD domain-containing protein [Bacteroidota bacterium]
MKLLLTVLIAFNLFLLSACKKEQTKEVPDPIACFNPSVRFQNQGTSITFQNCSENKESDIWEFGDGFTSTLSETSHSYAKTGKYQVSLKVTKGSKSNTLTKNIILGSGVIIKFSATLTYSSVPANLQSMYYHLYIYKDAGLSGELLYQNFQSNPNWQNNISYIKSSNDGNSSYYFKLLLSGSANGSNVVLDSLITERLDVVDGPTAIYNQKKLSIGNVGYNINIDPVF